MKRPTEANNYNTVYNLICNEENFHQAPKTVLTTLPENYSFIANVGLKIFCNPDL